MTCYVHGPRGIHAQEDPLGAWSLMVQDGLGSVRGVVDDALDVLWTGNPAPYGVYFGETGTRQSPYLFTGEYTDPVTELVHLRARDYHPALSVFASLDSFEGVADRPMSLNGYSWVEGNTPNRVDASGMSTCFSQLPDCFDKCIGIYPPLAFGTCIQLCQDKRRDDIVDITLEYLQGKYGQFKLGFLNPEGVDCNTPSHTRGIDEFVDLSNEVARNTRTLDDYLYVMNSVLLGLRTSGDLGVVTFGASLE